jgi:type I restriction-modification system DNA methylase subunit
MNRAEVRSLVAQTFTQAFDRDRFGTFAVNVLNHIDESKSSAWNSKYIKDAFKEHVNRYERLGTYTSPENETLDVLIVHLTKASKLERARTAIRNFVADHLCSRDEKDAALVAFVSPSEKQWRFSYVKMEYASIANDSGTIGVETHLTPARRFSYLVGEGESCHTAQSRFLTLLQGTDVDPSLKDIEEAFSVEAVTREFFTKYADLFGDLHEALERQVRKTKDIRDEFNAKSINPVDFAKKLLGQIVFLYFLQKKGWLGVPKGQDWGTGPHDFLRRLADSAHCKYNNFFNDVLEPLFYDTLATDRGHEAWCDTFKCRIPFLNGGLFEPLGDYDWRKNDIILPNELFTNKVFVEEGVVGTGVLDVFDRYNFTVNEAEPLEKEVAIDPEMLGKVFENLIEENRRKGLGAYYTPREIVHYMCQEGLIGYLDEKLNKDKEIIRRSDIETFVHLGEQISHYEAVEAKYAVKMPKSIEQHSRQIDKELADITICDPAVGSGAFPVGMMMEIVRARSSLTPYFNDVYERTPYQFKRHAIQNSLYGVDLDPGAVEIAKLRLWLSLVVDEEEKTQIKPLPNLDYKIMQGNSLLEEFEGVQLFDDRIIAPLSTDQDTVVLELKEKQILLQREYVSLHSQGLLTRDKQAEIKNELETIANELKSRAKKSLPDAPNMGLFESRSDANLKSAQLKQLHTQFFEATQRKQKEAIKNRIAALEWELIEVTLKEKGKVSELKRLQSFKQARAKPFFLWKLHFSEVFQEKQGFDIVIANPPWVFTRVGEFEEDFKQQIAEKYLQALVGSQTGRAKQSGKVNLFAIFILQGLRISRPSGHLIYIIPNTFLRATVYDAVRKALLDRYKISAIVDLSSGRFEHVTASTVILNLSNRRNDENEMIRILEGLPPDSLKHFKEVSQNNFLKNVSYAFNIFTNDSVDLLLNKIESRGSRLDEFCTVSCGIATGPGKQKYISDKKLTAQYKPLIEGKDVKPYRIEFKQKYILYDRKKLHRAREESVFLSKEKLVTQRISGGMTPLVVAYDDKQFYTFNSTNLIVCKDSDALSIKYLLALLNSKVINWYYVTKFTNRSMLTVNISKTFLEQLPIKRPTDKEHSAVVGFVEEILKLTADGKYTHNSKARTTVGDHERRIENLIYRLYDLSEEERSVVEASTGDAKAISVSRRS